MMINVLKGVNRPSLFSTVAPARWETVIGLEIHAQISSQSKLFSNAPNQTGIEGYFLPNSKVDLMDVALPGTLPVVNRHCVDCAIKTGLAINGQINRNSSFDRKHYFYCDLPHGYQITQQRSPIVKGGHIKFILPNHVEKKVEISHIQLEQDSGKSIHDQHPQLSLVDLNRAGVPLMEIVTGPDMRSSEEAGLFVTKLQELLRAIGTSSANMDLGEFRCDVNVSVHREDNHDSLGVRTELKNLNSIKFITKAIEYEAQRHIQLLEKGEQVKRETRFYDPSNNTTFSLRRKEDEVDYRFMPEPDIPPISLDEEYIENVKSTMPKLPDELREEYSKKGLGKDEIEVLLGTYGAVQYFEQAYPGRDPKRMALWITNDLLGHLKSSRTSIIDSVVQPHHLNQLLELVETNYITNAVAKEVLPIMLSGDHRHPKQIVDDNGWKQESNEEAIRVRALELIQTCPKEVQKYRGGNKRTLGFFVGTILKEQKGKANPQQVNDIMQALLDAE
ncbi:hypothetical protein PROFUN_05207 [Planoprotostelium fungivorum]|uniref:Glutamyl-tRNA(Gln) amidotransferase subunit B, mitochondrial n=1 Tax=Planoprotostelium fungivorum TaxID=1890364 RepID=A0A2P6NRH9_9EUKA|nr:hypothetical protein PROFUN_05207 [Planoprotostelium fungivorum]